MNPTRLLEFRGIDHSFERGVPILRGLSAEIPLEGVTFVVGKSGSGKSVLCRLAVGLLRPSAGQVRLLDCAVHLAPERALRELRARAPYLVQGPALLDWLTIERNVALAAKENGTPEGPRVAHALERVGLSEFATAFPPALGPGLKKRAAIARALVLEPEFLLLDEPTTGLDRSAAAQVNQVIGSLRREGLGALVVSHDYRSLEGMADRVVVVSNGQAKLYASRDEFLTSKDPEVTALLSAAASSDEVRDG